MPTNRQSITQAIENSGIVGVIRAESADQLVEVCCALRDGGVVVSEITMTTPNALETITAARRELDEECLIGVGTVLDVPTAEAAINAGAQFVVSPTLDLDIIDAVHRHDLPVVPGALSPTEIHTAWAGGADMVKVFPANHFGPRYFRDLRAPMPHLKLTPTGGVDLETAADWIKAGAVALGVGSALVRKDLLRDCNWRALTDLARRYVEIVAAARRGQWKPEGPEDGP